MSAGLALLGIDDFSALPPPAPASTHSHAGITAIPLHTDTGADKVDELSDGDIGVGPHGHHLSPADAVQKTINKSSLTIQVKSKKAGIKESNNNHGSEQDEVDEVNKKKLEMTTTSQDDQAGTHDDEEVELDGSPVVEEPDCEEYDSDVPQVSVRCPDCDQLLKNSWFLAKFRHKCVRARDDNNDDDEAPEEEQSLSISTRLRKRKLIDSDPKNKVAKLCSVIKSPVNKREVETQQQGFFQCPIQSCPRICETKQKLMIHLALSHFLQDLEDDYIKEADDQSAARKCPHCQDIQPNNNKLVFFKHIATEHEDVIEQFTFTKEIETT